MYSEVFLLQFYQKPQDMLELDDMTAKGRILIWVEIVHFGGKFIHFGGKFVHFGGEFVHFGGKFVHFGEIFTF